jgi:hypothetical protein
MGLLLLTAMIGATACASSGPAAPPSVDVTGTWVGTWAYENVSIGQGQVRANLKQSGSVVSGTWEVTGPVVNNTANVTGQVSGNTIRVEMPASGYMTVNGNQMTGKINGINVANVTLRKQ